MVSENLAMTIPQAMDLLNDAALTATAGPSRINPALTELQAIEIIRKGIGPRVVYGEGQLIPIFEKRVHQVCRNRVRPKY